MKGRILPAFAIILFASGCQINLGIGGTPGSGVSGTEDREIGEFTKIALSGAGKLVVTCGQDASLSVTTDDNLLPLLETKVKGDTLHIRSTESISATITPTYQIATSTLEGIGIGGSGDVEVVDLASDRFDVSIGGSGKVRANGSVENLDVSVAGSGRIEMRELQAQRATISISGSSRATVNAQESLDVSIVGSGRIDYVGDPKVKKQVVGSGRISQLEGGADTETVSAAEEPDSDDERTAEEDEEED